MNRAFVPFLALAVVLAALAAPSALAQEPGAPAPDGAVHLLAGLALAGVGGFSAFAFLLLIVLVFPGAVEKVRAGMEARPVLSPVLGLVNAAVVVLVVAAVGQAGGAGGILGGLILLAFLMVTLLGLAGRAQILGARAVVLAGRKPNPVANLAAGWGLVYMVGIVPLVGWVLFAYWAAGGVGGCLLALLGRRRPARRDPEDGGIVISGPDYTA